MSCTEERVGPMKPAATFIARAKRRSPWRMFLLAIAGAIALTYWNRSDTQQLARQPTIAAKQVDPPENSSARTSSPHELEINMDDLRGGEGIKLSEWLVKIAGEANGRVLLAPKDLPATLPPLRIGGYDGDTSLPLDEALDLLRYAGLSVSYMDGTKGFEVRWANSGTDDVAGNPDSLSLNWGALRSWQQLTIKSEREICRIEIGADGFVFYSRSNEPPCPLNMKRFQLESNPPALADSTQFAGPNWLHVPFDAEDALRMLRTGERRQILAALWRWNRMGADTPTEIPESGIGNSLATSISAVLKTSPSATQRRLALEALFRLSDKRLGEPRALCDDSSLALNAFLTDPSPVVQRSAAAIVTRLAGTTQLQVLARSNLAARPPAGTEQLLIGLVRNFWQKYPATEESTTALSSLIDQLLLAGDTRISERAAWAKMQNPDLDVSEKLRAAKAMKPPSLRAMALKSINPSQARTEINSKIVSVFLHDNEPLVRKAIFESHLPQLLETGLERTNLYSRGLKDPDESVRLAVLNSSNSISSDSRAALKEQIEALADDDMCQKVRNSAKVWLSSVQKHVNSRDNSGVP